MFPSSSSCVVTQLAQVPFCGSSVLWGPGPSSVCVPLEMAQSHRRLLHIQNVYTHRVLIEGVTVTWTFSSADHLSRNGIPVRLDSASHQYLPSRSSVVEAQQGFLHNWWK